MGLHSLLSFSCFLSSFLFSFISSLSPSFLPLLLLHCFSLFPPSFLPVSLLSFRLSTASYVSPPSLLPTHPHFLPTPPHPAPSPTSHTPSSAPTPSRCPLPNPSSAPTPLRHTTPSALPESNMQQQARKSSKQGNENPEALRNACRKPQRKPPGPPPHHHERVLRGERARQIPRQEAFVCD